MIISIVLVTTLAVVSVGGQIINRPPQFVPGSGDMSRFSLSENTPVGSPVYQLKGVDPDGGALHYSISGPVFSVDRDTGVVRLRQALDRETAHLVEVIISLTDEGVLGTEPNTISLRREIPVRDHNDNVPTFHGRPYTVSISEATPVRSAVVVRPQIIVTDRDEGANAEITISCYDAAVAGDGSEPGGDSDTDVCDTFGVRTERLGDGNYTAHITLRRPLDFETRASYVLTLLARDGGGVNSLSALATVSVNVLDVQDQPPVFLNAPYSATIAENTAEDTAVLTVRAIDGDTGNPRPIALSLVGDAGGYFKLQSIGAPDSGRAQLLTSGTPLDREAPAILQKGGVYTFGVRATELISGDQQPLAGDETVTQVQIVVTDVDDHLPEFNAPAFEIELPENLERGTPLPGLAIYVEDADQGVNSRYNLSLRNVHNAEGVFEVSPQAGEGRTPIVVKVLDPTRLDYDVDDVGLRNLTFDLVASVRGYDLSMARVYVQLVDVNDNAPVFTKASYRGRVPENAAVGLRVDFYQDVVRATDRDSGRFGQITYQLKGFGAELFRTDPQAGGLFVRQPMDYEQQKSYSLSIVARDGGGRETNAHIFVDVLDLNDNAPQFEQAEYTRTIREGATEFEPQFIVRATDADGFEQGGGRVRYSIQSENSISGRVFAIDEETGEIRIEGTPVNSMDTERGQYELVVRAMDFGTPSLSNTTRVLIRVGISGNQRPIFKGHFSTVGKGDIPGPPRFTVAIPEVAEAGYNVTTVSASDPDGMDALLTYRIVGANDNFVIGEKNGLVQVSSVARLDRDTNPDHYAVIINAVDAGFPIPETATATLYVNIKDVNDKPPKFDQPTYTAYISERTGIDGAVVTVHATDTDLDARLQYSIVEPIRAASKTGTQLASSASYRFQDAFKINPHTGAITVANALSHDQAAVIMLTVRAVDLQAAVNIDQQFSLAEVTVYVQSFKDTNPVFRNRGWTSSQPLLEFAVKEEMPIGSTLFRLDALDPTSGQPIRHYELVRPDANGLFGLDERTGDVQLRKRLDYERLNTTVIEFVVRARSDTGSDRETTSSVRVTVENVNDNRPEFEQKAYAATVIEGTTYPTKVITVRATDEDIVLTELDKRIGFNAVSYSLSGQFAELFVIDNRTGLIQIAPNRTLDRERQSTIRLTVTAEDSPGRPSERRRTTAELAVSVLDVNDNAPTFEHPAYSAVVPENAAVGAFVANVTATDPDEGPGGDIRYEWFNEGDANGLLHINRTTGEVRTRTSLTGKGRAEPYELVARAQDAGDQVPKQQALHSDVTFTLFIGDVSANDGIPFFVRPRVGEVAEIAENATIGAPVFQVVAKDYDNPMTANGQLSYRIQMDIEDAKSFRIDEETGLIITIKSLDRETKSSYNIIIEVTDHGQPPQATTRVLRINVLDVDDHKPRFVREVTSSPVEMAIAEEQPAGTVVGNLSAIDEDIDDNGAIDYRIIDGNADDSFRIERNANNSATILTKKRLDRETIDDFNLTVQCFKFGTQPPAIPTTSSALLQTSLYNADDPSHLRVHIRLRDIDDHLPQFANKSPAIGVRSNVAIDEFVLTAAATDADPEAAAIVYTMPDIQFVPQYYRRDNDTTGNLTGVFALNNATGAIRTAKSLAHFVDGYFELTVRANNSAVPQRFAEQRVKIFVIRDKSLLRFVFARPVAEVEGAVVAEFAERVRRELAGTELELYVLDTKVLMRPDHSLDFTSTSSCFQLSRNGAALSPGDMQALMDSEEVRGRLLETYAKYGVSVVDSCSVRRNVAVAKFIATPGAWLIIVAVLVGVAAAVATCAACCMSKSYKRHSRQQLIQVRPTPSTHPDLYDVANPVLYAEPIYGPV